ncbi:DUF6164 family protein [Dokdonella sp.]|uniref:DUF6164 family protein n=1 Tax=Dokdonella sp. TaxID=2291710 RepID=UPI001B1398C4|nr:DUF6164 family protein [Dokdonella sp.]MBO9662569.1 hypothetical protein [Dokdonella sp.]
MPSLLLNLRHVPDDEADEVRALLDAHRIEFYETPPSRWGISAGAIWITDEDVAPEAKRLFADYQAKRQAQAQADYATARREGTAPTWWTMLRHEPLRVLMAVLVAALVLGLLVLPVLLMSR